MSSYQEVYDYYAKNIDAADATAAEQLKLSEENIGAALQDQATNYHYWASISAIADGEVKVAESMLKEQIYSDCAIRVRDRLVSSEEKATDARVKESAVLDPMYSRALAHYHLCVKVQFRLHAILTAFEHRRDMARSLNSKASRERSFYTE